MMIDAHHHLWKYTAAEYGWITPQMDVIRRDFLPAELQNEIGLVTGLAWTQVGGDLGTRAAPRERVQDKTRLGILVSAGAGRAPAGCLDP